MDANLKVIVSAVDKASSTILAIPATVSSAFTELRGFVEDLKSSFIFDGAEYDEARGQFLAIADAYGVAGKRIEKTIDEIGEYQLTFAERTKVATKAVASGLQGDDLSQALTFVKRWSEATGQEFAGAAESMFGAFASGRFTALKAQFGLVIKDGASVTDVLKAMKTQLSVTADTGTNFADVVGTVGNVLDRIPTLLGSIIDRSPTLRQAFDAISRAATEFGSGFEDAVPTLAGIFEFIIQSGIKVYEAITSTFGDAATFVGKAFKSLGETSVKDTFGAIVSATAAAVSAVGNFAADVADRFAGLGDVFSSVVTWVGEAYKSLKWAFFSIGAAATELLATFYEVFSQIAEPIGTAARAVLNLMGSLVEGVGSGFRAMQIGILDGWAYVSNFTARTFADMAQMVNAFVAGSPELASMLGLDKLGGGLLSLQRVSAEAARATSKQANEYRSTKNFAEEAGAAIKAFADNIRLDEQTYLDAARDVRLFGQELQRSADDALTERNIGDTLAGIGDRARGMADSLRASVPLLREATRAAAEEISKLQIRDIDLTGYQTDPAKARNAAKEISAMRAAIEAEEAESKRKKEVDEAKKAEKEKLDAYRQAQQEKKSILEKTLRDIEEIEKKSSFGGNSYGFVMLDAKESALLAQKDSIKKALEAIEAAERDNRSKAAKGLTDSIRDYQRFGKDVADALDPALKSIGSVNGVSNGKLTIKAEAEPRESMDLRVSLMGGPTFFEELLKNAVIYMKGERVPFTFVARPA